LTRLSSVASLTHLPTMPRDVVQIDYPDWVRDTIAWDAVYRTDEERMRLAIAVSRENVERDTGGPFGAAVFESESGRLVAVGMNSVVRLNNCTLHGEMVAFMMAQARVRSFTLNAPQLPAHELVTSCEPCAMCLGATLWSGVRRLVYGAGREDASLLHFDEGPVFPESYHYLEARGITIVRNLLRDEAIAVLDRYRAKSGTIYNG
jgi:tRNA(Arg) A34 adenosine deaminase TadA